MCILCRGDFFTEPLPSDYRGIHRDWWEEFMKYNVEIDSGAVINMPGFIKLVRAFKS
jgi:hypothetical protein